MKKILVFSLALSLSLALRLPPDALASGELIGFQDYGCWNQLPQNPNPFTPARFTYVFAGSCNLAQTRLNLDVAVPWTGVGNYEPATGKTSEDIIVPPPRIDQPSRPYGRFIVSMHCGADPWLNQNITCDQISPTVDSPTDHTGPNAIGWKPPFALGPYIINAINNSKRPFTSSMSDEARNKLNRLYGAFEAKYQADLAAQQREQRRSQESRQATPQQGVISQIIFPSILSPTAGQRFYAQTPIPIKLAPPQGWNVAGYLVSLQRKDTNGNWIVHTNLPLAAAEAQSATGYTGFGNPGPGHAAVYYSGPGAWRVSAQISSPRQSGWSDWVEFTVVAPLAPLKTPAKGRLTK